MKFSKLKGCCLCITGSELTLANDVECFWLSGRSAQSAMSASGMSRFESDDLERMHLHSSPHQAGVQMHLSRVLLQLGSLQISGSQLLDATLRQASNEYCGLIHDCRYGLQAC